jgi:hypothetical protein
MIPRRAALLLPLLATACGDMRAEPPARLPPGVVEGAGDPARFAVETAAHALLDRPQALRGDPRAAAFAVAMLEHATTAFQDGRFPDGWHVTRLLREGRTALRSAIGVRAETSPQDAQDAFLAAAEALRRGNRGGADQALAAVSAPGARPLATLATLDLPQQTRRGLRETREMIRRANNDGRA